MADQMTTSRRPRSSGNDGSQPQLHSPNLEPASQPPLGRSAVIDIPGAKARQAAVILAAEEVDIRNTVLPIFPTVISYNLGLATHPSNSSRQLEATAPVPVAGVVKTGPEGLELLGLISPSSLFSSSSQA